MVTSASTFIITRCLPCSMAREADLGADRGHAGGVDHDVDQVVADDEAGVAGDRDLAGLHGLGQGRRRSRPRAEWPFS